MQYYYVKDKKVFARGEGFDNYTYDNGEWIEDTKCIVSDRLMGYDPSEGPDSTYAIGNMDIMDKLEEITEEEFLKRIREL